MQTSGQSAQLDLGHWLLRLIAYIIDSVIIAIAIIILSIPLWIIGILGGFWLFNAGFLLFGFPLLVGLLLVVYVLYSEVNWGGTLGKRIVGLRVQTVSGSRINYSQSFLRNISKIHWILLFLDWLIGVATPGDRKQKYMDRLAGTVVVQVGQTASWGQSPPSPNQ